MGQLRIFIAAARPCTWTLSEPNPEPSASAPDRVEDVHGFGETHVVLRVEEDEAVRAAGEKRGELGFEVLAVDHLAVQLDPTLLV